MTEGVSSPSSNEFWEVICHHDYFATNSNFEQNTGSNSAPTTDRTTCFNDNAQFNCQNVHRSLDDILPNGPNLAKEPQFPNENSYERIKRLKILQSQSILPILLIIVHPRPHTQTRINQIEHNHNQNQEIKHIPTPPSDAEVKRYNKH